MNVEAEAPVAEAAPVEAAVEAEPETDDETPVSEAE